MATTRNLKRAAMLEAIGAKDILQEIFIRVHTRRALYRAGSCHAPSGPRTMAEPTKPVAVEAMREFGLQRGEVVARRRRAATAHPLGQRGRRRPAHVRGEQDFLALRRGEAGGDGGSGGVGGADLL